MSKDPTMKDVAREAGVALGTVSKVFNDIPVGEEYRIKVENAAKRLGYKVNNYARGLKTNKTNVIAVILPSMLHSFYASLAEYLSRELKSRGYQMFLATTDYDPQSEEKCIEMVKNNKVDGIICLSFNPNISIEENFPFVSIDRYFNPSIPCVASDNFGGGQMAARKLTELGCKKLLSLRDSSRISGEADKRLLGFDSYCKMNNIESEMVLIYESDGFKEFYEFLKEHISNGKLEYDGIFCGTDHLAYNVLLYLRSEGIRVPEDVQIIGYDGLRKFGFENYFVSTIVQPIPEMAKTCVDFVLSDDKSQVQPLMCLPVTFGYGGTTKA